MVNDVRELLKKDFDEIKISSDTLTLLRCYSKLYLNGGNPYACEKSLRQYYNQLQIDGIMRAEQYEEMHKRTCKPRWNGLKFIPSQGRHFSNEFITDKQATELLQKEILKESDFEILPSLYLEEKEIEKEIIEEEQKVKKPKAKKTK